MENNKKVLLEEIHRIQNLMNLSEQNIEQKITTEKPDIYTPIAVLPPDTISGSITKVNKTPEGLENSKRVENELISINGYKELITHLDDSNGKSYLIWFKTLNQETRKKMIELFNSKLNELKEERRKLDNYNVKINKSGSRTEIIPSEELPDTPPIDLEFGISGSDVFVDNKSDVTSAIQSKIDELINDISETLNEINQDPTKEITLKVKNFMIGTSSSRFRNTEDASKLTWADLSSKRAKNTKEQLYAKLESLGVITSEGTIEFKGGYNGDGTSGPNPGYNPEGKPYLISKDGTFDNYYKTATKEIRNQYGNPLNTKEAYDIYKWIMVSITLVAVIKNKVPVKPTEIYYKGYDLEITPFNNPGTYKFPRRTLIKLDWFKKSGKKKKTKNNLTKCPKFNAKVSDPWWLSL